MKRNQVQNFHCIKCIEIFEADQEVCEKRDISAAESSQEGVKA